MQVKRHCAVKYRMYPNRAQAALIDRTIGCARFIYNQMLETRIGTYKATGKSCNPTPAQYKDRYPFLREVDSLALCNAQLNVAKAYRNFFRDPKHIGFPKYKAKHRNRQTYTTNNSNNNVTLDEGGRHLKLPKVGIVRVRQHKRIPEDWKTEERDHRALQKRRIHGDDTVRVRDPSTRTRPTRAYRRIGLLLPRPVRVQRRRTSRLFAFLPADGATADARAT